MTSGDSSRASRGDGTIVSGLPFTSSSGSSNLALGDGYTRGGTVAINDGDGSTASGGSITISLGTGTATSSGSVTLLMSNAGTVGVLGNLLLSTGTANVGNSGTLDIGSGSSVSGFVTSHGIGGIDIPAKMARLAKSLLQE